jgi:hypothetical protein
MKRKGWLILIIALVLFVLGGYFLEVFPDPYHEEGGKVNFFTWLYRELDELVHGERS